MTSPSEISDNSPKHLFGDGPVLEFPHDLLAGDAESFDRFEECPVLWDDVELPSESSVEKLWLNLDRRLDIEMPWEKGTWKQIFGDSPSLLKPSFQQFARPAFTACPSLLDSETAKPSKRLRVVHFADHWKQVVTTVDALSWTEEQEAKLDTAIKVVRPGAALSFWHCNQRSDVING